VLVYSHQINQNNEEQMDSEGIDSTFPNIYDYKTRKELEAILKEMRMPDQKGNIDEENFAEAIRNLLKGMQRSKVRFAVSLMGDIIKFTGS
jgi:translation initiation factor IF-2